MNFQSYNFSWEYTVVSHEVTVRDQVLTHTYGGKLLHSQIVFKTWVCSIALVSSRKQKDLDVVIYVV